MNYFTNILNKVLRLRLLFFLLISITSVHGQFYNYQLSTGEQIKLDGTKSNVTTIITNDGKIQSIQQENPDEVVRLIVTFKTPSLSVIRNNKSVLQKRSLTLVYNSLQANHTNFRSSLNTIKQDLSVRLKSDYGYKIIHDYYHALNGVAIECKTGMISKIKALSMVKNVSLDKKVKINFNEPISQIRADLVQDSLGYDGEGVLIGNIDTGMDYNNPALGGGFGPNFKVIGGFDFVNNDNDPIDDHGHGTHVGGIIGANGSNSLQGVAPGVKFLAVKVLDSEGGGYATDIIAGIDYCLDPDNNPETDDAVDLINMSLGTSSLYSPLDSAVNNATKAGILSVVAAGNDGHMGYGTLGSPGTSESALTVGACDSVNQVAYFSSKGPEPLNSSVKPEVIAPGVNILSTVLNNETARWSGTSMAAPHVAGIAALIKQKHPEWKPEEIKAVIINTARSVDENVSHYVQGKGLVDAFDAATSGLIAAPGILSFGRVDLIDDNWSDTITVKVKNFRNVTQNIHLSISNTGLGGALLTLDKNSFSLLPMEETSIMAILNVPSSVPVATIEPFSYTGKITVGSDSDNVVLPVSFIKSTMLIVNFDIEPSSFIIYDIVTGEGNEIITEIGKTQYVLPVRPDNPIYIFAGMETEDSVNAYTQYNVVQKIDNLVGLTYTFINHEAATISVLDKTIHDAHNNLIQIDSSAFNMDLLYKNKDNKRLRINLLGISGKNKKIYFSPLGPEFIFRKEKIHAVGNEIYVLKKYIKGLQNQQDADFLSGADNMTSFNFNSSYHNYHDNNNTKFKNYFCAALKFWDKNTISETGMDYPFTSGKIYINQHDVDVLDFPDMWAATYIGICKDKRAGSSMPMLQTPYFNINSNNELVFENVGRSKYSLDSQVFPELRREFIVETIKAGDTIRVEDNSNICFPNFTTYLEGNSLYLTKHNDIVLHNTVNVFRYGDGGTISSNGLVELTTSSSPYWNLPRFNVHAYSQNEARANSKPYKLWDNSFSNPSDYLYAYYVFDNVRDRAGLYRITGETFPYKILGQRGQCVVDYEYQMPDDTEWPDNSTYYVSNRILFPSFSFLQVSDGSRSTNNISAGQNGKIRLVLFNPNNNINSVELSLVSNQGDEITLPVSFSGTNEYTASIPTSLEQGFIDIVARATDAKGNKCKLTASPAFYFGNTDNNLQTDARLKMTSYSLDNHESPNFKLGDTLNYTISYTNIGNLDAKNVTVDFPLSQYFKPLGAQSWSIDSLAVDDTVKIPVNLEFLGKGQSDEHTYFTPSITWNSGDNTFLRKHNVLVDFQNTISGVEENENIIPNKFELFQNYPNPFNPATKIKFALNTDCIIKILVYDILGREVANLLDEYRKAGLHEVAFNAGNLSSGIYFYQISNGQKTHTKKMMLLK